MGDVKLIRNISITVLGILFLMSTSGVLIFHTHCACIGTDRVTVYITPESCEETYHQHHTHDLFGEEVVATVHDCHECSALAGSEEKAIVPNDYQACMEHDRENEFSASAHDCQECIAHTNDCGCGRPEVIYVKLDDQMPKESIRIAQPGSIDLLNPGMAASLFYVVPEERDLPLQPKNNPPPLIIPAVDFLISIHQLKISVTA